MVTDPGCVVIDGVAQTEIVTAGVSAVPQEPVTRTQYDVVAVSAGVVYVGELVPTGALVSPAAPRYH